MTKTWHQFLAKKGAVFQGESIISFEDNPSIPCKTGQTSLIPLTSMAVIRVSGPDAEAFLHSQLTTDIKELKPGNSGITGYCNPKGRLFAIFYLTRRPRDFLLVTDALIAKKVVKHLSMYVLRQKVNIDIDNRFGVIGFTTTRPSHLDTLLKNHLLSKDGETLSILAIPRSNNTQNTITIAPADFFIDKWSHLEELVNLDCLNKWTLTEIQAGMPSITLATQERFIPQSLNLDIIGGINFKKGCYPGQEIVARVHYLGRLKQRMVRAAMTASSSLPRPGEPLTPHSAIHSQKAGSIVNIAKSGEDLVELLITAPVTTAVGDTFTAPNSADIVVTDCFQPHDTANLSIK